MSIQRIQQKNLLLPQIKSASLHQQQAALSQNCPLILSPKFDILRQKRLISIVGSIKGPKMNPV